MKNKYHGWYNMSRLSEITEQISPEFASTPRGSLTILDNQLVLNIGKRQIELPKSQVKNIEYFLFGRFKIHHSLPFLYDMVFSPWWPFGLKKKLNKSGYDVK